MPDKLTSKSTKRGKGAFETISEKFDRNKALLVKGDPVVIEAEIKKWLESIGPQNAEGEGKQE